MKPVQTVEKTWDRFKATEPLQSAVKPLTLGVRGIECFFFGVVFLFLVPVGRGKATDSVR